MTSIQIFFILITMPQLLINLFSCLHLVGAKQVHLTACIKVAFVQMVVFGIVSVLQRNQLLQTVVMVGCLIVAIRFFVTKHVAVAFILGLSVLFLDGLIQMIVLVGIRVFHLVVNENALMHVMLYTFTVVALELFVAWLIASRKINLLELEL